MPRWEDNIKVDIKEKAGRGLSEFPGKVAGYFEHGGYIIM
jgi:hypothetical protein